MTLIKTLSPVDQTVIVEREGLERSGLDALVDASARAGTAWAAAYDLPKRLAVVNGFLDRLEASADALGADVARQMGRPISFCAGECRTAVLRGRYLASVATDALATEDVESDPYVTAAPTGQTLQRLLRKVPLGPVVVVGAWNYPYLVTINALVPALLAGNSVILKPSPQTPLTAEAMQSLLRTAGLPDDVLQVAHIGDVGTVCALCAHPGVQHVCFTGSLAAGRAIELAVAEANSKASSRHFTAVGLELGGKDPAYVMHDADLDYAAEQIADGVIFNSGQSCCAIERVYVHTSVYDAFVDKLASQMRQQTVLGDPLHTRTTIGPVVSLRAADAIRAQVDDAVAKGARPLLKPEEIQLTQEGELGPGYVYPQLLVNVDSSMAIMRDETFGPVVGVQRVRDDEHARQLMNENEFGLTASLWTSQPGGEAAARLLDTVEAGTVFVNRADYPDPALAWTGWKNSGRGVTLSRHGFDQFYRLKSVHIRNPRA